ncbi:MAG: phosphatase PAP2 family protein [Bacteroidota bacterium]
MLELLQEIDKTILLAVNSWNSPFCDSIMWWISGKFTWWPFYLALMIFIFWKKKWRVGLFIVFGIILIITLSDQTSVHFFKEVFERPRPSHHPELTSQLHYVNNYKGGKYGFISSHASNSFAVATFLLLVFRKKWFTFILLFWAALVSYSRMYLGVHYFFDVLAGALWGALIGFIIYKLYLIPVRKLQQRS